MLQKLSASMVTFLSKWNLFKESLNSKSDIKTFNDSVESVPNLTYPGDNSCTFYDYRDFGGDYETKTCTSGDCTFSMGDFGKRISSYECGKNVRLELHNFNSPSTGYEIVSSAGHLRSPRIEKWMEDRVKEVKMSYYDQWSKGSATVWGWLNCEDIGAELPAPDNLVEVNTYTGSEAW